VHPHPFSPGFAFPKGLYRAHQMEMGKSCRLVYRNPYLRIFFGYSPMVLFFFVKVTMFRKRNIKDLSRVFCAAAQCISQGKEKPRGCPKVLGIFSLEAPPRQLLSKGFACMVFSIFQRRHIVKRAEGIFPHTFLPAPMEISLKYHLFRLTEAYLYL